MPRLSIDLTDQQHQQLKVIAALNGQTIKDLVIGRTFGEQEGDGGLDEESALRALQTFLDQRLQQVREGKTAVCSSEDIKARARALRDRTA